MTTEPPTPPPPPSSPSSSDEQVVLVPARARVLPWTLASALVLLGAGWTVAASDGAAMPVLLLLGASATTGVLATQAVAPSASTVVLRAEGLEGRRGWRRVHESFAPDDHVTLGRVLGDPVLVVVDGRGAKRTVGLPFGADLTAAADLLRRRGSASASGG